VRREALECRVTFLGIEFNASRTYGRIYRNAERRRYQGSLPRMRNCQVTSAIVRVLAKVRGFFQRLNGTIVISNSDGTRCGVFSRDVGIASLVGGLALVR